MTASAAMDNMELHAAVVNGGIGTCQEAYK